MGIDAARFASESRTHSPQLNLIEEEGYVVVKDLISPEQVAKIRSLIDGPLQDRTINGLRGYIQSGSSRFLAQTLSWGREIIDVYTDPKIVGVADAYVGAPVHLSNYRIYKTYPSRGFKMAWHVDNKTDVFDRSSQSFLTQVIQEDKGIILLLYLTDVNMGGTQLVAGSHKWSWKSEKETWDDEEHKFKDKIVSFNNVKAGTGVLYDYRCIHRAQPFSSGEPRITLFAQYSPPMMPAGEPIILNSRDLNDLSDFQKRILNFGKAPTTENWPVGRPEEILSWKDMKNTLTYKIARSLRG